MTASTSEDSQKPQISRFRKILIWVFIIGFWLLFYWHRTTNAPDPAPPPPVENSSPSQPRPQNPN